MAQTTIAKTSVGFTADTSGLNRGVAAAENRLQNFEKSAKGMAGKLDAFSEKGKKALSGLGAKADGLGTAFGGLEGLGGITALAGEFGVVGAAIAAVGVSAKLVMDHYNQQLEKAKKRSDELDQELIGRNQKRFDTRLNDNNNIPNVIKREIALRKQLNDASKEQTDIERQKNRVLAEQAKYEENYTSSFLKRNLGITTNTQGADRDFENELKTIEGRLKQAKANHEKALDAVIAVRKDATLGIEQQIETLRIQNKTFGMSAEAVERYKASLAGVDKNLLRVAAAWEKQLDVKKKQDEIKKSVDDLSQSLKIQIATWGQSAEQVSIYTLRTKGASEAQLQQAQRAANVIGALRQRDELMKEREEALQKLQEFKPQAAERSQDLHAVKSTSEEAINAITRAKADFALQRDADKRNQDEQKKQTELLRSIDERLKKVDLIIKGGGR